MTRQLKAAVLALGIVGLLVLVAMAARGGHPGTSGHAATRAVPNSIQDGFITLLAIAYAIVIVVIVIGVFRNKHRWQDPKTRWLHNFALVTLLMLIATGIGYYGITHSNLRHKVSQATHGQMGTSKQGARFSPAPVPAREAQFQWPLALAVGGLILLGGIWLYVRRRRELMPREHDGSLEADMVAAIETTIDDLRSERDARRAVIAAYALMESTLRTHGLARHRAETPGEYLGRILRALDVRESAVRALTDLFEYAKFSSHEIDATMKEQAIDALLAVREDLRRDEALAA